MKKLTIDVVFTPKYYSEIASRGMECSWGAPKDFFWKTNAKLNNDERVSTLKKRVLTLLDNVPLETIQKCARRVREYELFYLTLIRIE